jgi:hypothetical protein
MPNKCAARIRSPRHLSSASTITWRFTSSIGRTIPSGFRSVFKRVLIVSSSKLSAMSQLSHLRSMNGQTQSGGHWKVALGLMASGSVCFGFSGSGEESSIGTLFIMRDTPSRKVAVHQSPFRPRGEPQTTHSYLPFRSRQSSFARAAKGTLIPVVLSQFPCPQVGATCPRPPRIGAYRAARSSRRLTRRGLVVGRDLYFEILDGRRPNDERFYQLDDLRVAFAVVLLCFLL